MARQINRLNAAAVKSLTKPGRHADGGGLYLSISKAGDILRRRWVLLYRWEGKSRELGLGPAGPDVPGAKSLAEARQAAREAQDLIASGIDPIAAKREAPKAETPTFGTVADDLIEALKPSFRNDKHAAQWETSLGKVPYEAEKVRTAKDAHKAHIEALEKLRALPVDKVNTAAVLAVISPIWHEAPETASRIRGRIERVLDAAKVKGLRTGENPAAWRGHLALVLPKRSKVTRGHHEAMAVDEVPAFVARLRATGGVSALALEFAILTAARTGEVLGATWGEIDMIEKVWTVPVARMKAGRPHRVPLSGRAVQILNAVQAIRHSDVPGAFVFPGQKKDKGLSQMSLAMVLRRHHDGEATPHGFRSTFRDWAGDHTAFSREVAEAALAHAAGDATEQAYRRGDALEKRRALMCAWEEYLK